MKQEIRKKYLQQYNFFLNNKQDKHNSNDSKTNIFGNGGKSVKINFI